jgi:formylmethanofuran dehydrogenase subunit C
MINLCPLREFRFPVIAECIRPDVFQDKKCEEINRLKVWEGNKQRMLSEIFKVEESEGETAPLTICGDVSQVRRIGSCMEKGEIIINGNVGMHLGEEMKGGKIIVYGNVGSWAGSMMKDGMIEVYGNVGDYLGAPYRGSSEGMHGGRIIVHGNVGSEAGAHMRNGIMKIYGNAGQFVGFRMHNGTILVQKDCAGRAGACMVNGRIIVEGHLESVLPTFTLDGIRPKVKVEEGEIVEGSFYVFLGDLAENGSGKLYVLKEKNPHLGSREKLL